MRQNRPVITVAPAMYVFLALAVVLLPLKLLLAWLLSVLVHEMCHIFMVILCQGRINGIRFSLTGAQIITDALPLHREIICVLAGPIGSILLLVFFRWYPQIAVCGFIQAVFNLMPFINADGGKVLSEVLRLRMNDDRALKICTYVDGAMRLILCLLGLLTAWKLSWPALGIFSCVYFLPRMKIKYPCKRRAQQVQYR